MAATRYGVMMLRHARTEGGRSDFNQKLYSGSFPLVFLDFSHFRATINQTILDE